MVMSRAVANRRRAGSAWAGWAAVVAALAMIAEQLSGAAGPAWAEEVALVVVIGVAAVIAPPVLARLERVGETGSRDGGRATT